MRDAQEQLGWEARAGRLAAGAALVAAALIVASLAYRIAALPRGAGTAKEFLPDVYANKGAFVFVGVISGLAMLAFIPPLLYLYDVTRHRRPEIPGVARVLIFLGPILFAICSVWLQARQIRAADQFAAGSVKTNKQAEDLLRDASSAPLGVSLGASIAVGLATILVSLHAMRAGLLSRFMGVLGIILGALFVLPLLASPIIQLFWLLALGAVFIDRWPGGRGPAWETGEAIPWPTSRERHARDEEPEPEPEPAAAEPNPRAARRRKKKARR